MGGCSFTIRIGSRWLLMLLWASRMPAQTCLMLSQPTVTPDGKALLNLSLYSQPGAVPAALQWAFQYPSSGITSLSVDDGPSLTAAGKTSICNGDANGYTCLAVGANMNRIANGVIAEVTAVLAPGSPLPTIQIQNAQGASPEGYFLPIRVSQDCRPPALRRRRPANAVSKQKKEE